MKATKLLALLLALLMVVGVFVACGGGESIEVVELQAPNAKRMQAKAYLAGKKIEIGTRLGDA